MEIEANKLNQDFQVEKMSVCDHRGFNSTRLGKILTILLAFQN